MSTCVCGHPKESHKSDERNEFGCDECGHAKCRMYREVLDWPDSEGEWRMEVSGLFNEIVYVQSRDDGFALVRWGKDYTYTRASFPLTNKLHFVKLCENNPFA